MTKTNKLVVAKSGVNALEATDPNDFIFHSDYNTLKIIKKGVGFPSWADTGGVEDTQTVAHGMDYTPFLIVYGKFSGSGATARWGLPGTRDYTADFWWTGMTVDATNINLRAIYSGGGSFQMKIYYYAVEVPL